MSGAQDPRFARLQTDPRFRRPKQKQLKVEIDERFKDVLESEEFGGIGAGKGKGKQRVDKHGRPMRASHHQDQLKRFYRLKSPSPGGEAGPSSGFIDYARGEGNLESSGSEDGSDDEDDPESEIEEEELEVGGKQKRRAVFADEFDDEEEDDDADDDESGDEDHLNIDLSENEDAFPHMTSDEEAEEDEDEGPTIDPTTRIAAVNLDWDNLRAGDLFIVFNSFLKQDLSKRSGGAASSSSSATPSGRLLSVKIYPSEFGKERMAKEDEQGPGGGAFINKRGKGNGKSRKGKGEIVIAGQESDDDEEASEDETAEEEEEDLDPLSGEEGFSDNSGEEGSEDEDGDEVEDDVSADERFELPDMSRPNGDDDDDDAMSVSSVRSDRSEEIDADALRQYQLDRLRYYYAVATFSTVEAAARVMEECQGTEFERTANVLDLSYVPDGMEFEEAEVKDTATKEPKAYKGNDFVTDALRHSKVKLTWDQDDPNRVKVTRRNLTQAEIEEQDFKDYIASSDDDDDDEAEDVNEGADDTAQGLDRPFANVPGAAAAGKGSSSKNKAAAKTDAKKSKKAEQKERTEKLRALLLSGNDADAEIWGKAALGRSTGHAEPEAADLEITFKPALTIGGGSKDLGAGAADDDNLTTLERYQLRMKEKKQRKKEKMEVKRGLREDAPAAAAAAGGKAATATTSGIDDFFGDDSESETETVPAPPPASNSKTATKKSVGTANGGGKASQKPDKAPSISSNKGPKASEPKAADNAQPAATDDDENGQMHFSMKDIAKAEKEEGLGGKKRKRKSHAQRRKEAQAEAKGRTREIALGEQGWKIDTKDERFKALHDDPQFAIDPSNPHFTKTQAMQDLLAARNQARAKQARALGDAPPPEPVRQIKRTKL